MRAVLAAATILSLLICLGVCMLWARGETFNDGISFARKGGSSFSLDSQDNGFEFFRVWPWPADEGVTFVSYRHASPAPDVILYPTARRAWERFGVQGQSGSCGTVVDAAGLPQRVTPARVPPFGLIASPTMAYRCVVVPHTHVAAAAAVLPLTWLLGFVRRRLGLGRRRMAAGLCTRCGYDLRASQGRCPECGEPIARATGGDGPGG